MQLIQVERCPNHNANAPSGLRCIWVQFDPPLPPPPWNIGDERWDWAHVFLGYSEIGTARNHIVVCPADPKYPESLSGRRMPDDVAKAIVQALVEGDYLTQELNPEVG